MIVLGVTGGIGSGKSEICKIFGILGAPVYNSDERARSLLDNNENLRKNIILAFGDNAYEENKYNRKYIASLVFNSKEKLQKINKIVHPAVQKDFQNWLTRQHCAYAVIETAILQESGFARLTDFILFADAPVELRITRVCERDGLSPAEVKKRINNQMNFGEIRSKANWYLMNDNQTILLPKILEIHNFLQNESHLVTK
ncbi:MAG: dephospho-CoA kinase [Clostridiaceae bacterium]|nr:dephospho-CoA kinase [Clostridiaceae bacterium]